MAFVDCSNVPLAPAVPLFLNHGLSFLGLDHVHLEASSLDFGLVYFGCLLLSGQDGLRNFLHVFKRFQLLLAYTAAFMGDAEK